MESINGYSNCHYMHVALTISSSNIRIIEIKILSFHLQIRPCYFYKVIYAYVKDFQYFYAHVLKYKTWAIEDCHIYLNHFIDTSIYDYTITKFIFCLFKRKYLIRLAYKTYVRLTYNHR